MNSPQIVLETSKEIWSKHIRKAVLKFLKTAVVVDNDPREKTAPAILEHTPPQDSGLGEEAYTLAPLDSLSPASPQNFLDIRKISDSFSEHGMACAFVLPEDEDPDEKRIISRAVASAKTADILVLDWHLRPKSSSLTLKLLESIAKSDEEENGRMRLICIYTGEPLDEHILNQATEKLTTANLKYHRIEGMEHFHFCAKSENSIIVLANKDATKADILPVYLIDLFAELANGLIPAFALAAIGAVRKNTHHMLTRFGKNLDSAYVANRLITNPPGDVAELMRDLLVAECDNAIGLDSIADNFLEPDAIRAWLAVRDVTSFHYRTGNTPEKVFEFNSDAIEGLLQHGINDHGIKISNSRKLEFPEQYRNLVSQVLAGTVETSRDAESEFSRLVAFRREAYGSSATAQASDWLPSLTTGTLLKSVNDQGSRYYFCFTPACDTLRLTGARPFVFLEGVKNNSQFNLIALDEGIEIPLHFDKSYPKVTTYSFKPDKKFKRVRASISTNPNGVQKYLFTPQEDSKLELIWLGEIRYGRAMSEMATLASRWMRVGVLDSEHLRLASRKNFPFR